MDTFLLTSIPLKIDKVLLKNSTTTTLLWWHAYAHQFYCS